MRVSSASGIRAEIKASDVLNDKERRRLRSAPDEDLVAIMEISREHPEYTAGGVAAEIKERGHPSPYHVVAYLRRVYGLTNRGHKHLFSSRAVTVSERTVTSAHTILDQPHGRLVALRDQEPAVLINQHLRKEYEMHPVPPYGMPLGGIQTAEQIFAAAEASIKEIESGSLWGEHMKWIGLSNLAQPFGFHDKGQNVCKLLNAGNAEAAAKLVHEIVEARRSDPLYDRSADALRFEVISRYGGDVFNSALKVFERSEQARMRTNYPNAETFNVTVDHRQVAVKLLRNGGSLQAAA